MTTHSSDHNENGKFTYEYLQNKFNEEINHNCTHLIISRYEGTSNESYMPIGGDHQKSMSEGIQYHEDNSYEIQKIYDLSIPLIEQWDILVSYVLDEGLTWEDLLS